MAVTEIQKVPGQFNLPAGWPRLDFPDTTTGLVADFRAADLPLGTLSADGWKSTDRTLTLKPATSLAAPVVRADSRGQRYLQIERSRLSAVVDWSGPVTMLAVVKTPFESGRSARITSGGGAGWRRLGTANLQGFSVATDKNPTGVGIPEGVSDTLTAIIGRFGPSQIDGMKHGGVWSTPADVPSASNQTQFLVAAGTTDDESQFFKGNLYQVQVWNRVLSKSDAEAALQLAANTYRF